MQVTNKINEQIAIVEHLADTNKNLWPKEKFDSLPIDAQATMLKALYDSNESVINIPSSPSSVKLDVLAQAAETPSMAEMRRKYEGTEQWMKVPNGERSNLTERQWMQVRTPEFKRWFGDWKNETAHASKTVDENGEPLVVDGLFLNLPPDTAIRKARQRVSKAEALTNRVRKAEEATGTDAGTMEFGYAASDVSEAYALADPDVGILTDAILKGRNPRLTVGFRYGEVPAEMQSRNYRDDSLERGVSIVGHVKDLDTRRSAYYDAFWGSGNYNNRHRIRAQRQGDLKFKDDGRVAGLPDLLSVMGGESESLKKFEDTVDRISGKPSRWKEVLDHKIRHLNRLFQVPCIGGAGIRTQVQTCRPMTSTCVVTDLNFGYLSVQWRTYWYPILLSFPREPQSFSQVSPCCYRYRLLKSGSNPACLSSLQSRSEGKYCFVGDELVFFLGR